MTSYILMSLDKVRFRTINHAKYYVGFLKFSDCLRYFGTAFAYPYYVTLVSFLVDKLPISNQELYFFMKFDQLKTKVVYSKHTMRIFLLDSFGPFYGKTIFYTNVRTVHCTCVLFSRFRAKTVKVTWYMHTFQFYF